MVLPIVSLKSVAIRLEHGVILFFTGSADSFFLAKITLSLFTELIVFPNTRLRVKYHSANPFYFEKATASYYICNTFTLLFRMYLRTSDIIFSQIHYLELKECKIHHSPVRATERRSRHVDLQRINTA